jgi:hypothetical protein
VGLLDSIFKPVKKKVDDKLQRKLAEPGYQQQEADMRSTFLDPASSNYKGPSWDLVRNKSGQPTLTQSKDPTRLSQQYDYDNGRGQYATDPNTSPQTDQAVPDAVQQAFNQPVTNPELTTAQKNDQLAQALKGRGAFQGNAFNFASPGQNNIIQRAPGSQQNNPFQQFDPTGAQAGADKLRAANAILQNGGGNGGAGSPAPDIDRTKIDSILGGLNTYANDIYALSKDNTGSSLAEAQLAKGQKQAQLNSQINLEATQRGALSAARSSRSRADRGLLERAAVGEQAYLGQEGQRQDAQRQADFEGNQAILRAQEEDSDRRFRLDALSKASDLGLNTAALETDISKANLGSATDWVNNQFQQLGIDKQINQQQAESILGYTRDMAAIQFQYDQLSEQEKQAADAMIMQKYGIDQQTGVALKGIKEQGKFHWDQMLGGILGGVGAGATGGIASLIGGKKGP